MWIKTDANEFVNLNHFYAIQIRRSGEFYNIYGYVNNSAMNQRIPYSDEPDETYPANEYFIQDNLTLKQAKKYKAWLETLLKAQDSYNTDIFDDD